MDLTSLEIIKWSQDAFIFMINRDVRPKREGKKLPKNILKTGMRMLLPVRPLCKCNQVPLPCLGAPKKEEVDT